MLPADPLDVVLNEAAALARGTYLPNLDGVRLSREGRREIERSAEAMRVAAIRLKATLDILREERRP